MVVESTPSIFQGRRQVLEKRGELLHRRQARIIVGCRMDPLPILVGQLLRSGERQFAIVGIYMVGKVLRLSCQLENTATALRREFELVLVSLEPIRVIGQFARTLISGVTLLADRDRVVRGIGAREILGIGYGRGLGGTSGNDCYPQGEEP